MNRLAKATAIATLLFTAACDSAPAVNGGGNVCHENGECTSNWPDQTRANTPRMGVITGTSGAQVLTWETYDFSIGAFSASAWMRRDDQGVRMTLVGYDPEDEQLDGDFSLFILATLPEGLQPGRATDAEVWIVDARGLDTPRYSSIGAPDVTVTALTRDGDHAYGAVAGRFSARLCRAASADATPDPSDCRDLAGTFDTQVQFDNM